MKCIKLEVKGLVQGIGFRPFVAEIAEKLGLSGQVYNAGGVVFITAIGSDQALEHFVQRLTLLCPKGGRIDELKVTSSIEVEATEGDFVITESVKNEDELRFVPADLATCEDCEAELVSQTNRRYQHPFISCVSCGPRYSIMKSLPYDRDTITMDEFEICEECYDEYTKKGDRRRHAQTIACKKCGPVLSDSVEETAKRIRAGQIVAVKDIGGYHICFDPFNGNAAKRLRQWKNRENKPFAVMFKDVAAIEEFCSVNEAERELLESSARPIVLLDKIKDFDYEICCGSDRIGAMLPCNPLQILLIELTGPLVMTSCNRGGEPIVISDEVANALVAEGAVDFVLSHNREILTPLEDSVTQVHKVNGKYKTQYIRRGRGYVPNQIDMGRTLQSDSLACGGDLKAVFGLGRKNFAFLSAPYGDLDDYRCAVAREKEVKRMTDILGISPREYVMDAHPGYISRGLAEGNVIAREIFHHHAHLLSVMAEHHLDRALGIAWDGTGFGEDGEIWGGEWLVCEDSTFHRAGSLAPVKLMGADIASKDCKLSAMGYLVEAGIVSRDDVHGFDENQVKVMESDFGKVKSTSMGRLFDAVAFVTGVCDYNTYEGEAAGKLETLAMTCNEKDIPSDILDRLAYSIVKTDRFILDSVELVKRLYELKSEGVDSAVLARAFHVVLVEAGVDMVRLILRDEKLPVVFSGGCFANRLLYRGIFEALEESGYEVYTNEQAPCTDGGIALGQLYALTFK